MFDPKMRLEYPDGAASLETTVTVQDPETGEERGGMWDNLTHPIHFIVQNDLKIISEELVDRPKILIKDGERELRGTEGTAVDGVTKQAIMDGWRERQGKYTVEITCTGDPSVFDQVWDSV